MLFSRLVNEAHVAVAAGDPVRELAGFGAALALLSAPHPVPPDPVLPGEALMDAIDDAEPLLREHMIDLILSIANAIIGRNLAAGVAWLSLADAAMGIEMPGESAFRRRLRSNLHAMFARVRGPLGEAVRAPRLNALGFQLGEGASGDATVQALAAAMEFARTRIAEGDKAGALVAVDRGLRQLDMTAELGSEVSQVAQALRREIIAPTPLQARLELLHALDLMRRHSPNENISILFNAAGYAIEGERRDLALADGEAALRYTCDGLARNRRWNVYAMLTEVEGCFKSWPYAALFGKLAVRELCRLRAQLADFDPELGELSAGAERLIEWLVNILVDSGRLGEAEAVNGILGVAEIADTFPPTLSDQETAVEQVILAALETDPQAQPGWLQAICDRALPDSSDQQMVWFRPPVADKSVALSYYRHSEQLFCLVRRSNRTERILLPIAATEANRLAYTLRQAVGSLSGDADRLLGAAYDALIAPLAPLLQAGDVLTISAHGGLALLPWSALRSETGYLVERHVIVRRTPRAGSGAAKRFNTATIVSFANTRGSHGKEALGQTAGLEAREVAKFDPLGMTMIDEAFTAQALSRAAQNASIIHIASHFVVDPSELARSQLLLGDGTAIELRDLVAMDFSNVKMLMISACDSGHTSHSPVDRGIDILLLGSGASSVVGTLWAVDSEAMALISPELVRRVVAGYSTEEALALTQRALINGQLGSGRYANPFYFAGIVAAIR